jgi:4-hydroxybenzoate polyprenyltransferase
MCRVPTLPAMTTAVSEEAAAGGAWRRLGVVASDIKLAHSVFAMPFAVLGAFLARTTEWPGDGPFVLQLALVVLCMVCARTWAMLFNRLVDRRIDAANPRTARRALPAGRISAAQGWACALAAAGLFVGAASLFGVIFGNWWPAGLSVPVLAWIALYSLTKRFTILCHVFLGGALGASPLAAAIAVNPSSLTSVPSLWCLAAMVVVWVAGFDIIYALQDVDFDRGAGLFSIPARLGWSRAVWVSRGLHALALAFLLGAWRTDGRLDWLFGAGIAVVAALLIAEHAVLARRGKAGLDMAFFTLNGVVSCVLGVAGCLDTVLN